MDGCRNFLYTVATFVVLFLCIGLSINISASRTKSHNETYCDPDSVESKGFLESIFYSAGSSIETFESSNLGVTGAPAPYTGPDYSDTGKWCVNNQGQYVLRDLPLETYEINKPLRASDNLLIVTVTTIDTLEDDRIRLNATIRAVNDSLKYQDKTNLSVIFLEDAQGNEYLPLTMGGIFKGGYVDLGTSAEGWIIFDRPLDDNFIFYYPKDYLSDAVLGIRLSLEN